MVLEITQETVPSEFGDYQVYKTEVRGRKFEILKNEKLSFWTVYSVGKGDPRMHFGKTFDSVAEIEAHYKSLAGISAIIQ